MHHVVVAPDAVDGGTLTVAGGDARHLTTVLRLEPGDRFEATAGAVRHQCRIASAEEGTVVATIIESAPVPPLPLPAVTLVQGIARGSRFDDALRMATEMGIDRIVPLVSHRCVVRIAEGKSAAKRERWQGVAHAAAKQSHAPEPVVDPPTPLADLAVEADLKLVFWEESTRPLKEALPPSARTAVIVIGPEGGLTAAEVTLLHERGYVDATLGPTLLRTETAPVAAIAAVRHHYG